MHVERWHSTQNKTNRSCGESVTWWRDAAIDKGFAVLNDVISVINDGLLWEKLGLRNESNSHEFLAYSADHPTVERENELASFMGDLAVGIVTRRMRSSTWFEHFPGMFPALLDATQCDAIVQRMKQAEEDWKQTSDLK